jgi:hypothetical protein
MWLKTVIASAIAIVVIYPTLITLGWHLQHGNTIQSRGVKVFVPLRWIAEFDDTFGVEMWKLPFFALPPGRIGSISVRRWPVGANDNADGIYKTFETLYWTGAVVPGVVISGPTRNGFGTSTFCMETSFRNELTQLSESCLVLPGRWRADFRGDNRDLRVFFEIIRRMN